MPSRVGAHVAVAAADLGLEGDPRLEHAVGLGDVSFSASAKLRGFACGRQARSMSVISSRPSTVLMFQVKATRSRQ